MPWRRSVIGFDQLLFPEAIESTGSRERAASNYEIATIWPQSGGGF